MCSKTPSVMTYYIYHEFLGKQLLTVIVSQTFLVFDDIESFEEYWSGIFQDDPPLEFV